jgi:alkanesulfonate monooxygenase SsuD/methylene tetrahydromethanopterin reductase-like flavin-dependent oxidoreductase (luciferase family)
MRHIWSGKQLGYGIGPVGPSPSQNGGPPILLGAVSPTAIDRVGHLADGFIASPGKRDDIRKLQANVNGSWKASGRTGKPRFVTLAYYCLGPNSLARGISNLRHYFSFIGDRAEEITSHILNRPQDIKSTIREHSALGADELIFLPTIPDIDQVDRLAELVQ